PAADLLIHAAGGGAARGGLRAFAGGLFRGPDRGCAVRPPAELSADAALHLRASGGHKQEQRGHAERRGDAVERRALHSPKVDAKAGLSTIESVPRTTKAERHMPLGSSSALWTVSWPRLSPASARGTALSPSSPPSPSPTRYRRSRSGCSRRSSRRSRISGGAPPR